MPDSQPSTPVHVWLQDDGTAEAADTLRAYLEQEPAPQPVEMRSEYDAVVGEPAATAAAIATLLIDADTDHHALSPEVAEAIGRRLAEHTYMLVKTPAPQQDHEHIWPRIIVGADEYVYVRGGNLHYCDEESVTRIPLGGAVQLAKALLGGYREACSPQARPVTP